MAQVFHVCWEQADKQLGDIEHSRSEERASFSNTQGNVVYGVIKVARFGRVPEILNLCDNRRVRWEMRVKGKEYEITQQLLD